MLVDFVRHVPFERGTLPAWVGTPRCMSFGNITLVGCTHDNSNNDNTTIPNKNANVGATIVTTSRSSSSFVVRCIARHRRRCRRIVVGRRGVGGDGIIMLWADTRRWWTILSTDRAMRCRCRRCHLRIQTAMAGQRARASSTWTLRHPRDEDGRPCQWAMGGDGRRR